MDRFLQTAANFMRSTSDSNAVIANNIANISTVGFVADVDPGFKSLYVSAENTLNSRVVTGQIATAIDIKPGALDNTGNPLDVAVQDADGFMLGIGSDGNTVFTRRGDFSIGVDGVLYNGDGIAMMGDGAPILIPSYKRISIESDGRISVLPQGSRDSEKMTVVGRLGLVRVSLGSLIRRQDGQLVSSTEEIPPLSAEIRVLSGHLQKSNVDIVDAMVAMIENTRQYEASVKILKTAESTDDSGVTLVRIPN
jgi:flagellar basal-body rod protein FlgF